MRRLLSRMAMIGIKVWTYPFSHPILTLTAIQVGHCHLDEGCCEERSDASTKERFLATALEMTGRTAYLNGSDPNSPLIRLTFTHKSE